MEAIINGKTVEVDFMSAKSVYKGFVIITTQRGEMQTSIIYDADGRIRGCTASEMDKIDSIEKAKNRINKNDLK